MDYYEKFEEIIFDKENGSTTIALNAIKLILEASSISSECSISMLKKMQSARPEMSILVNISLFCQKSIKQGNSLYDVCNHVYNDLMNSIERSASNASKCIPKGSVLATISKSEQLDEFFRFVKQKIKCVYVLVSGSVNEEKLTYNQLKSLGIKSFIFDISSAQHLLKDVDFVFVSCDLLSRKFFINKKGTKNLVQISNTISVPTYVLATKWKILRNQTRTCKLNVNTDIFEKIPNDLVDFFVFEDGVFSPHDDQMWYRIM